LGGILVLAKNGSIYFSLSVTSGRSKGSHLFASVIHASPQAFIMFALLGVVFFLRKRCAPGRRFPCGLALGSHLVLSIF